MISSIISRKNVLFLFTAGIISLATQTHAGVGTSLMQTADVVETGQFEGKAQGDVIFNNGGGFNISAHLTTGLVNKFMDLDALIGSGKTNFQAGGIAKYNLLPDINGQVGLSFLGGVSYLRDDVASKTENLILATFGVLVSKKISLGQNIVDPYGAFEYEILFGPNDNVYPMTLILGGKWINKSVDPWVFYSEFGIKIKDSLFSFSVGAGYPF